MPLSVIPNLITGIGGMFTNMFGASKQRSHEQNLLTQQMKFAEKENALTRLREDNAWQRQAIDMKAAGINPLYSLGNGASANLGMGINPQMADLSGYYNSGVDAMQNAVNSALGNVGIPQNLEQTEQTIKKIKAEINNLNDNLKTNEKDREKINAEIGKMGVEEAGLWQQIFESLTRSDLIHEEVISEQIRQTLLRSQNALTANQISELSLKLEDDEYRNKFFRPLEYNKLQKDVNISYAEYENLMATYYKTLAETKNAEKQAVATELRANLEREKYDNRVIDKFIDWLFGRTQ